MSDDVQKPGKYDALEDLALRRFLEEGDAFYPADTSDLTMQQMRQLYNAYCASIQAPRPERITALDTEIHGVPCRFYRPQDWDGDVVTLFIHGGGFVVGDLDTHDDICAEISDQANMMVVAVAYRLAPEFPFPAAFDDCWQVLHRLSQTYPKIIVMGDSAGGNLAAGLVLKARDEGAPKVLGNVLVYPALGGDETQGSYITQGQAPGLTTQEILHFKAMYAPDDGKFAGPLKEVDYSSLPPTLVVTAAIDPLSDDGAAWVNHLQAAGGQARLRQEPHLNHAFLKARHVSQAAEKSFAAMVDALRSLGSSGQLPPTE